jgi:hypothetical protein
VKILVQLVTWSQLVVVRIVGYLVSIHHRRGHFNATHKVEVVVALLIRVLFNGLFVKARGVVIYTIMYRQSCSDGGLVRDKVEIIS